MLQSRAPGTWRRAPVLFAGLMALLAAGVAPWVTVQVGPRPAFLPAVLALVACLDLLSCYLLLQQFRSEGDPRLLGMAVAYVWSLVVMLGYAGAFPGLVGDPAPLSTAASVAPWLYVCWHTSFPVLLALAWVPWSARLAAVVRPGRRGALVWVAMATTVTVGAALVALVVLAGPRLPVLIRGLDTSRMTSLTAPVCLPLVAVAAVCTARALRSYRGPERWTSAAVWACLLDLALTYASGHRYSVGWFAGRGLTVVAAAVVLLAMLRQVTRVKATLHDTLERERRIELLQRTILDNLSETVVLTDLSSRVLMVNDAARTMLPQLTAGGPTPPMPMRTAAGELLAERDQPSARTARTGEPSRGVVVSMALTGDRTTWLSINTTPVLGPDGRPGAVLSSLTDVTDRECGRRDLERTARQLELALADAVAADLAKTTFLATMSHEIRTPINAVIGLTGLLLNTSLDERQRDFVEGVHDSGEALLRVINDILDFSRIEAGGLELENQRFATRECAESALAVVAVAAGAKGLELVLELADSCPAAVSGDATRFRQVLVNLLSNALKFTPSGEVVVTLAARPAAGEPGRLELEVRVSDTGIGIPTDRLDQLFRSFSQVDGSITRTYGGSGLGLVISRRLARAMGGDLRVSSRAGAGSTFVFTARLDCCPDRPAPGPDPLRGRTVLLVDDNDSNRAALARLLAGWGVSCTEAAGGAAALLLLQAGRHVDLALVDLDMPGLSGLQLEVAVRQLPAGRDLPVVLMTSPQWSGSAQLQGRFAGTLSKPVRAEALRDRLCAALDAVDPWPATGGTADDPRGRPRALRVLLAEDNLVNQKVALLLLDQLGYQADVVANGLEAVAAARLGRYDVILMDVQMPLLDGLRATQQIRSTALAHQPVIVAVTASVLVEDQAARTRSGMDDYLSKPIRAHELAAVLERVARSPGGSRQTAGA